MKNIEKAIFPLIFVLCMCGFCVFEYPQGRPRLYLSIFYILISWLLYIYFTLQTKTFIEKYEFPPSIYFNIVIMSIFMVLSIYNVYYHKRFKDCLKKLDIVNDTLEELGTMKNYAQLRVRTIWLIIGWIISIFAMNIIDSMWYFTQVPNAYAMSIYLSYIINHMYHIGTLYDITFLSLLRYIGTLFEHINQYIQTLIEQKKRQVKLTWMTHTSSSFMHRHLIDTSQSKRLICLLMQIHFELSSISRELNIVFGLQLMMQVIVFHWSAMEFILELYPITLLLKTQFTYENAINLFSLFVWSVRCTLNIVFFCYICEEVCMKANRVETFLNRLANITFDVETQESIMQFLLEILRRPLKISGLGFYDYGFKFLHKLIERSMKMIIIVIQTR